MTCVVDTASGECVGSDEGGAIVPTWKIVDNCQRCFGALSMVVPESSTLSNIHAIVSENLF